MQEKEFVTAVRFELKIPSHGITVRHHSAKLLTEFSIRTSGPLKILIGTIQLFLFHRVWHIYPISLESSTENL